MSALYTCLALNTSKHCHPFTFHRKGANSVVSLMFLWDDDFNHSLRLYLAPCTRGSSAQRLALLWPLFIPTISVLLLIVSCLFAWCGFCRKHFLRAPLSAPFGTSLWFPCWSAVMLLCFPSQPCSPLLLVLCMLSCSSCEFLYLSRNILAISSFKFLSPCYPEWRIPVFQKKTYNLVGFVLYIKASLKASCSWCSS